MQNENAQFQWSHRASFIERSVMRELLKHAVDPNIISLAGGLPPNEHLPLKQYQECINTVFERDGARAIQYGPPYLPLMEWVAGYMNRRGVDCSPENIFITNGNQHGLMLLSQLFIDEGDRVILEETVFTGTQQATIGIGAKAVTIPTDLESGADVVALEKALAGHDIKLIALIPDFHNPLGVSMSVEKRQQVAALAANYKVPIVEDDAYSQTRFVGDLLPPVRSYDQSGYVFYLGSFSKMLAPGLRLGWIVIPNEMIAKITSLRESIDLETSGLTQRAVAEFVMRGYLEPHIEQLRDALKKRADALMTALDKYLSDLAIWTIPEGGLFSWCVLPESINTWELFDDALQAGVVYIPGGAFSVHGKHKHTMRLNFSRLAPDQFDEGIRRLNAVIRKFGK